MTISRINRREAEQNPFGSSHDFQGKKTLSNRRGPNLTLENRISLQNNELPFWKKVLLVASLGAFVGIGIRLCMNRQSTPPEDPLLSKNILNFVNDSFPNVVVVGDVTSPIGRETLDHLTHLGISYKTEGAYDRSSVPLAVWSQLEGEPGAEGALKERVIEKVKKRESLTKEDEIVLKGLQGASAAFFLHRRTIMKNINKYNKLVNELEILKKSPETDANEIKKLEMQVKYYSSILIFEHNVRFGHVNEDKNIELSKIVQDVKEAIAHLPEKWQYFSLLSWDWKCSQSKDIEGTCLYHPGWGMGLKAYAISHEMYPALENEFSVINEREAMKEFHPIDVVLRDLSWKAGIPQIAPRKSFLYRKASPSGHAPPGADYYVHENFGSGCKGNVL